MPDNSTGFLSQRMWDIGLKIGLVITPLIGGALIAHEVAIRGQNERINAIQSSRFTDKDGEVLRLEMRDYVDGRLKEFPPKWLELKVDKIDATVTTNTRGIIEMTTRLGRIEEKLGK